MIRSEGIDMGPSVDYGVIGGMATKWSIDTSNGRVRVWRWERTCGDIDSSIDEVESQVLEGDRNTCHQR